MHCAIQHDNAVISAVQQPASSNKQPAQPQCDKPQRGDQQRWRVSSSSVSNTTTNTKNAIQPSTSACRAASCRSTSHADEALFAVNQVRAKDNRPDEHKQIAETVVIIVNAPITLGFTYRSPRHRAGRCRRRSALSLVLPLRKFSERFRCHTFLRQTKQIRLVEKTPLLAEDAAEVSTTS